ncbi:S8 family peptidase [Actinokineospora bangkokensis]|uniref:Serine protease n=1 Tax=Actinokineospora bangkokensis TaxID=1193682 RepID=A0A1Q9LTM0_9PSEU|nr:S8 family serine peptidase [Actinokineospora bangkokensis]OLR95349.1 serine protease [Actinokineospora bangkokensis]
MPLHRRATAVAAGAALLAVVGFAQVTATAAPLPDDGAPCAQDTAATRYLVLFDRGTPAPDAATAVTLACGSTLVFHAPIAVAVVTSADSRFADRIGRDRAFSADAALGRVPALEPLPTPAEPVPTADRTGEQWDMDLIGAPQAHEESTGSRDVLVGVLDSGIDATHPDLAGAVDPAVSAGCLSGVADPSPAAWAPTTSTHGTHVAGIIAAADDGRGVTGVAPGVRLAAIKVVDDRGMVLPEAVVCGVMWAVEHGVRVANDSFSVDPWQLTCDRGEERVVFEAVRRAVDYATDQGVLTVAAATNGGLDLADPGGEAADLDGGRRALDPGCEVLPGGLRGVLTVSAVGPDGLKAGYSSYGLGAIDVTAPGGEQRDGVDRCVLSTVPGGYADACGTSMATPHATGVAALLASAHPTASPQQLTRMITEDAGSVPCPADYDLDGSGVQDAYCSGYAPFNSFYGHGLVDALAATSSS